MEAQIALQNLLRKVLLERRLKDASYSVRALARRCGLPASAANEILKGERRVSRKMAEKILVKLMLDPIERNNLLALFPENTPSKKKSAALTGVVTSEYLRLSSDQFEVISSWEHFAILSLLKLKGFKPNVTWISTRLGISTVKTQNAIKRLFRLGLVTKESEGRWVRIKKGVRTTDDVQSMSIQKSHLEDMNLARESILRDSVSVRDFSSATIPVDRKNLPKAKEVIRKAQDQLAELLAGEDATEVYKLSVYLYPLTVSKNRSEE